MDFQYSYPAFDIGATDHNLPVKPSWPQQGRIQNIGAVGRRDQDDPFVIFKSIHLNQKLIEGLFPLIVATAQARAAMSPDCVNFINKNQTRAVLFALLKQVTDP